MSKRWRIRRSWISLLLVLVMTVQLLPVSVMATEVTGGTVTTVAQGNCGPADESGVNADNAGWKLTSDGTLTISGTGQVDHASAWNIDTTPIKSVVIGDGITEIVSQIGWWDAETISLPASLTAFDAGIISGCRSLKSITLAEGSETYKLVDGALLSKDGTVLYWHPRNASDATAYDVPSGVKTIGDYALYGHGNLNTITLPEGLVTIGDHAFNSCRNLNCTLTIPATVKTMGKYCLSYNNNLTIVIPADSVLETIGEGAMSDNYTETLTLPATLKSVGARSLPFGMKTGAILTFYSRTVAFADEAISEGSTVYGYPGSTVEEYANAVNSNDIGWDDINFIPLESSDPDLSGQGKTIGFLPGLTDSRVSNYATELGGVGTKMMGFAGEKAGISLVSGSVKDEKDAVLTKLSFKLQLQAHLADSTQAIPQPVFALSSAKDADTTLSVVETTTDEQLASGARHYTISVDKGSFADGEIVLTCAYANGLSGFYDTYMSDVQAVYAYTDGSKTGKAVQPAKVVSVSYFVVDSFVVGGGTAVEIVPGGLNTEPGAASLFAGGWKRGSLPAAVDGKPAIYQTIGQSATVSLKLTADPAQNYYSKTTVKCYLSDSAADYASGRLLKQASFTDGDSYSTPEALVKAHPIELTLPTQAANSVKYLTAEVTTLYALYGKSGSVVKTHTAAIVTKAANEELYTVSADGTLTGYDGSENTMTLPARVGTVDVEKVGALADGTVYGTGEVVVSPGIKELGDNALKDFRDLTAVTLPNSIRAVGSKALATGGSALTLRVDSADPKAPAFASDAVDLSATHLTVQCYAGSATEAWANALREANPDKVTVTILDTSRMLLIEIKDAAGQALGQDSFTAVEWFREGSDTVLGHGVSYILLDGAAIGASERYVCKVTFSPAIRWDYTVPVTMRYIFDSCGTQSYQLPSREKNITVTGSFRADQIDDAFRAYLIVQEPDGELRIDLPVTSGNAAFSVDLSGRYPATLYAENASGGKLTMPDVQSRPATDGTIDLGELTLPNRNIQQTIESKRVYSPDNWRMLYTLVNNCKFVLLDEAGSEFTDFTLSPRSSSYDQTCWLALKLGDSVRDKYFVGDTLTLRQIPSNDFGYRLEDAEITLQLGTQTAAQFDLNVKVSAMLGFYSQISSDYYVFDEAGALVCHCSWGAAYVDPGTYTVIGIRKNAFITSLSSPTELEELGIPEENYLKNTVTLAETETYYAGVTPDFLKNTITLTATADEQMMANGIVPVYIQYHNQLAEQFGREYEWTITIYTDGSSHEASLPLEKLDGKYAYCTDGEIVSETTDYTTGSYRYEKLDLKVRGASGSICLYADATGRTLKARVADTNVLTTLTLPRESISMTAPERSTAQEDGMLRLYAHLTQHYGTSYIGRVYVDTVAGVTLNTTNAKLTVTSDASAITVTITATSGSGADTVTGTKTVSITKAPAVPTTVTISGGVSSVNVPEVETLGTPGSYTTSAFTATVKDQYGQVMTDRAVTWSVLGDQDTIYMTPDGKLHLTSEKWNGSTTVTATVTGTDVKGTKDVTINRDQGISRKAKFVEIYNGEAKVTTDSIVIPSGSTPNTAAYTAKVYDQYDVLMSEFADLNWSLSSTPTGVTMTDGTVTVASSASVTGSTPLTLTATAGTGTSAPMATVDISIVNKQTATVSITGLPTPVTYGTEFTLTASAKDSGGNDLAGGTWTWSFDTPTFEEVSKNGASITLKAKKASTDTQSIKATYEDANYRGDANTTNFQVKPRPITVTAPADYKVSKTYDGTTNAGTPTGSLTADGILSGDAVTVKATPAAYANANVHDGNVAVNLELDGSKKDNYKLNAASVSVPCEITAKELTNLVFTGVSVTKVYDTSTSAGTVSGAISFDGKVGSDEVSIKATAGNYTDANVGTGKTVPLTLALDGTAKDNYKLNSYTHSFTTASITKANYSGTFSKTVDIVKGRSAAQTGSLTAADFLATPPAGAKINSVGGGSHTIISNLTVSDGELNYTSNANIAATADETYTVTISSTNYDDITATLKFHPTDKQPQAALTINSANSVTYGQTLTLSTTGGSSGGAVTYAVSAGTGTATVAGAVLTPTTAGTVTVVATMAGDDTYEAVSSAPFTVTIAKATPAGTPSYTSITSGGKTLADAALGIGSITPTGSIKWVDSDGTTELLGTTAVAANTAYKWLFTPADTANYNTLTGTLTLYHVSTGGGGGSVSYAISVDKAQNGSITVSPKSASKGDTVTITVAPDKGYTLETLTVLDKNSKEISVTAKDGKYTFTMPASKVTVKATFAEDNSMLNFFVDVPASEYYYDAVKWAVENGITSGIGGGKFAPDETCIRAQSATFLYRAAGSPAVSGSAAFSDVGADAFYANAVAWAAKEGITGGIGGGLFGSELECTRAQIVTFLYRSTVK